MNATLRFKMLFVLMFFSVAFTLLDIFLGVVAHASGEQLYFYVTFGIFVLGMLVSMILGIFALQELNKGLDQQ